MAATLGVLGAPNGIDFNMGQQQVAKPSSNNEWPAGGPTGLEQYCDSMRARPNACFRGAHVARGGRPGLPDTGAAVPLRSLFEERMLRPEGAHPLRHKARPPLHPWIWQSCCTLPALSQHLRVQMMSWRDGFPTTFVASRMCSTIPPQANNEPIGAIFDA